MSHSLPPYPAYKPAGLPWLAQMPAHWEIKRAKQVFRTIDQRSEAGLEEKLTVSSKSGVVPRREQKVTMFMAASYVGHKLCWPGDLVVNSLWAWANGLGFAKHHGIISTAYSVYRALPEYAEAGPYLDYLLRSSAFQWEFQIGSKGIWISRLQLTDDTFMRMPILLPPLPEQQRIVAFLGGKTRQIARLLRHKRQLIQLLTEQKQALIHRAVTQGLDPAAPRKPSGVAWLGEVPAHWEVKRLKNVSRFVTSGSRGWAEFYSDEGAIFLRIGNLSVTSIDLKLHNLQRVTPPTGAEGERTRVQPDDLLISITALLGAVGVVPEQVKDAYVNQHTALVRLKLDAINSR
ncbi:restriction endonuclease subunit S [uncultured Hymenobacter sp.]|uniref:restriction endonuclease subunit S n=1 Tax=uncultured Hymenobacter sp. TaxID=170016 RepID=UPI0035CA3174